MKAIFSKLTERAAVGKESSFELRGHKVDMKDAERYFKRKGFSFRDVISWKAAQMTMPRGLRCFTPEPQERLLADARTYCLGCFENGTWVRTSIEHLCYSVKKSHTTFTILEDIRNGLISACVLLSRNSPCLRSDAFKELQWVCSKFREIVIEEDPQTIPRLIEMMILVNAFGRPELVVILLRHLAGMSATVLSMQSHPMSRIFAALCDLGSDQFQLTALRAWEVMIDVLQEVLGPTHLNTVTSKFDRLDTASSSLDLERQERYLETMLKSSSAECAPQMLRSIALLTGLATYFAARKRYRKLLRTGTEIVHRSQSRALQSTERNRALICGYEFVAEAQYLQCQFAQAAATFALLAKLASVESASLSAKMREYQARSEECLRKLSQPGPQCHTCLAMPLHEEHSSECQCRVEPSDRTERTCAADLTKRRFLTRTLS
jgi:hypothetical protein